MRRERLDLLYRSIVSLDAVHLHADPRSGDRQWFIRGNSLTRQQLGCAAHHSPVLGGLTLQQRQPPPVLQRLEQRRQVLTAARLSQRRLVGGIERGAILGQQSGADIVRRGTRSQRVPIPRLLVVGPGGGHANTIAAGVRRPPAFQPGRTVPVSRATYAAVIVELRAMLSPALEPLWRAVHERLSSGRPVSQVRVGPMSDEQRSALADLLGMARLPAEHATVQLSRLDELLHEAVGAGVREVVTELVGPVDDRAGDRLRAATERAELWDWLREHPVVTAQPVLDRWAAGVRRTGLIAGSVQRTRDELAKALRVLAALPASGVPLPVLADELLHDPHGLDEDTRCATLVARALSIIYDVPVPADTQERRALWEQAGVADDELSSVVLTAGLRPPGDDAPSRILRICADAGQAAALTLRQTRAAAWTQGLPDVVWVFENPSVLALALARFATRCPPMVCTSGWPSSAGMLLLQKLGAAGCALRYHGDFDGEGIRIAANLMARTNATPWHMSAADYRIAVRGLSSGPAVGRVTEAPWDPHLAAVLRETDITISEEGLANGLFDEMEQQRGFHR